MVSSRSEWRKQWGTPFMASVEEEEKEYLSLKDVARVLGKNEAALRARIKRGNLEAITRPLPSCKPGSKRFRYLIPLDAVKEELERIVRKDPVLQLPLDPDAAPNLYQLICEMLARCEGGLTLEQMRWQLERFHGLSLRAESLREILDCFSEFVMEGDRCTLQHPLVYDVAVSKSAGFDDERPEETTSLDAQALLERYEQRLNVLEAKLEILIQLLSSKINP